MTLESHAGLQPRWLALAGSNPVFSSKTIQGRSLTAKTGGSNPPFQGSNPCAPATKLLIAAKKFLCYNTYRQWERG